VRSSGSIRSGDEQLKSIPVCDLFHRVALDTAGPLPETKSGNKYILVAIDHYSKWCKAKAVTDHGAKTATRFLEDEIICRYGVPKFVLTDNGMAKRMIKTIKHGVTVLVATPANMDCWDQQLAKVLFGYRCGIQTNTKFSPFMILTGQTPRLRADNYLQALIAKVDDGVDMETVVAQFLQKVELIVSIHNNVLLNVEQAQQQQKKVYAARRGKHLFEGLIAGETMVKMKKSGKRRVLTANWEGPYQFIGHSDGKCNFDFGEGCRLCIVQDADGHQWERSRRDLQIFYVPLD